MNHVAAVALQLEMPFPTTGMALPPAQFACLEAVAAGHRTKSCIALAAKLDLARTAHALETLVGHGLVKQSVQGDWRATRRARQLTIRRLAEPDAVRSNPGKGGRRLLEALARPMSAGQLASALRVTPQRVHQIAIKLHASGQVRLGDPEWPMHIVARADDPTPLLTRHETRVLARVPSDYATSRDKIRIASGRTAAETRKALARLCRLGLVERSALGGTTLFRLLPAGTQHPQYDATFSPAEAMPLKARSTRVRDVLTLLRRHGQLRIVEVASALQLPQSSINALFQHLKRKCLVRKTHLAAQAPYALTREGSATLEALARTRGLATENDGATPP